MHVGQAGGDRVKRVTSQCCRGGTGQWDVLTGSLRAPQWGDGAEGRCRGPGGAEVSPSGT